MKDGTYERLKKQIDHVCLYDLTATARNFYLLCWAGDWLITTNPQHGARLIGCFDDGITKPKFEYAVYAAVNKARPG